MRRFFSIVLLVGLLVLNLVTGLFYWCFKDGMKPGFAPSHGLVALTRFWRDFWHIPVFSVFMLALAVVITRNLNKPEIGD